MIVKPNYYYCLCVNCLVANRAEEPLECNFL